ncbi:carboxymuconolactone decarboxylase family protein [Aquamicrobium terrae]
MNHNDERVSYPAFMEKAPAAYAGLVSLVKAIHESGLEPELIELVEIRASQINGCAFCLQYHLSLARKVPVSQQKLDLLAVWREAGIFTARESAALAWTEALTNIGSAHPSDETWLALKDKFTEQEIILLTVAVGTINQWNRIAGGLRFSPMIGPETKR